MTTLGSVDVGTGQQVLTFRRFLVFWSVVCCCGPRPAAAQPILLLNNIALDVQATYLAAMASNTDVMPDRGGPLYFRTNYRVP